MPALPVIAVGAAVVGAGAAVYGTAKTIKAQNREQAARKEQFAYERQINQNRAVRDRRDAIRAARIAGANLVQNSENTGGSGTSAAMGGMGSIQSQLNSNLSFLDTQSSLADKAGVASQAAVNARANGEKWGAISNLGMAVFNASGGINAGRKG